MASSFWSVWDRLAEMRKNLNLPSPGSFEQLHKEVRGTLPTNFMIEGARFELHSVHNQNFQTGHSMSWGSAQQPAAYQFTSVFTTPTTTLVGQVDHDGSLSARANYNWIPLPPPPAPPVHQHENSADPAPIPQQPEQPRVTSTTKLQAMLPNRASAQSTIQIEHDHTDLDWSLNIKAVNANPVDAAPSWAKSKTDSSITGTYSVSYLQSVTKSLAVGAEMTYQRAVPDIEEPSISYAVRYAPPASTLPAPTTLPPGVPSPFPPVNPRDPTQVLTATWMPSVGLLNASAWRRINQRLELGADLQLLMTPTAGGQMGRREGIASVGFKLDTLSTTLRAMLSSHGQVSAFLEERISPGIGLQLSGEIDYARNSAGRVGFGFTFEA
ncbi:translocase of outer mitochondrial membrane [Polyrhizophydium stewartii]|uniref:Translocase of outer mitochondrial membrane n=1 Tax=Polyrhizophydium stewartii TaxID=2732419 RepID=A0ABR4NIS7_9FUNG|nr:translocase of outer mitochondrial membrane [Polyrhizophydium stewartii]